MRSRLRWKGSWVGAGSALLIVAGACGSSGPTASESPTPSPSPSASANPTPSVGDEVPVAPQALAPATDLPVAQLCSKPITTTADGNAVPLTCSSGALNVRAWAYYRTVSASVLGLGLNPTEGQVDAAICDDLNHNHATRIEEASGYALARLYYGWSFNIDVSKLSCP